MPKRYNKFRTGEFQRNFAPMSPARQKLLIMPLFEHCDCDSFQSRVPQCNRLLFVLSLRHLEKNRGVRQMVNHTIICNSGGNSICKN